MARLDLSVLVKVLGQQNLKSVNGDLAKIDTQADKTQSKLANAFNPKNLLLGGGIAFAGAQVLGFLNDAAGKASDLEEAQSKVNVVFGEGSDQVTKWAEGSAEGFLLSKSAALEAAGTYGNLFQAFGIGRESATEMSTTLVELAADMASFNNTSVDDALVALRSGLSGETEPLKRYGVALNDARLRQKALELGIYNGVGALDSAQKAQASYNLILEDTSLAQGDVARTGDQLANSQREVAAKIENAQAEVGKAWASIELGAIRVAEFVTEQPDPSEAWGWTTVVADRFRKDFGIIDTAAVETADTLEAEFERGARAAGNGVQFVADSIRLGGPVIAREANKVAGLFPAEIAARDQELRDAGYNNVVEFAAGMLEAQSEPEAAIEALRRAQEESLDEAAEIAWLKGQLIITRSADGMQSSIPSVRIAAQAADSVIRSRLSALGIDAHAWGSGIGYSMANGIYETVPVVKDAAGNLANAVFGQIGIRSEPRDSDSPLRGITEWGGNIAKELAHGIESNLSLGTVAGAALASTLVPSVAGGEGSRSSSSGTGGDIHYHTHLTVQGDLRAADANEAAAAIVRAQNLASIGARAW